MEIRASRPGAANHCRRSALGLVEAGWLTALALVPTVVNPFSRQSFEPDKTALLTLLVVAMMAAWSIALTGGGGRFGPSSVPFRRLRAAAWVVAATLVLSTLTSIDPYRSWAGSYVRRQGALTELLLLAFLVLVARHLVDRRQWRRLATVLVVTGVPVCVYTLYQRLGFDPVPWDYALRVGSTTGNPVFLGAYLALLPPVTLALAFDPVGRGGRRRMLRLGLILYALGMQIVALLLTESRGPFVALAAGVVFMALGATHLPAQRGPEWSRRMRRLRLAVVALGLALLASLAALGLRGGAPQQIPVLGRLATTLSPTAKTTTLRMRVWQGAERRFAAPLPPGEAWRPWIGHGPETFALAFAGVASSDWAVLGGQNRVPDRAHNEVWELAVTRGVLGTAGWLVLLGFLMTTGLRALGLLPDRRRLLTLLAATVGSAASAALLAVSGDRPELLGPAVGVGGAVGVLAFVALAEPGASSAPLPRWRRLAVLALVTVVLVHWIEIQVGFGLTVTRVVFFATGGALVGLARRTHEAEGEPDPRHEAAIVGLCVAIALTGLGFALGSSTAGRNSPAVLLLGSLVTDRPAPWVTPYLCAILASLAVAWALLEPAQRPTRRRFTILCLAAVLPTVAILCGLHAFSTSEAETPLAAARGGIVAFRWLVAAVLGLLAVLALTVGRQPRDTRSRRRLAVSLAVVSLPLGLAVYATDGIALDRVEADVLAKHGFAWLERGEAETGRPLLDEASRLDPREWFYWHERGRLGLPIAARSGSRAEALDLVLGDLRRAADRAPREPDAWANLGLAHMVAGAHAAAGDEVRVGHLQAADRAFTRALALRPQWPRILLQHAGLADLQARPQTAAKRRARAHALSGAQASDPGPGAENP